MIPQGREGLSPAVPPGLDGVTGQLKQKTPCETHRADPATSLTQQIRGCRPAVGRNVNIRLPGNGGVSGAAYSCA